MKTHEKPSSVAKNSKRFVLISILTVLAAFGAIYVIIQLDPMLKEGLNMAYKEKFNQRRLLLASSKLPRSDNGTLVFLGDVDSVPRGEGAIIWVSMISRWASQKGWIWIRMRHDS